MIYFNRFSHRHVSVAFEAIFMLKLLQEHKNYVYNFNGKYNNFNCYGVTTQLTIFIPLYSYDNFTLKMYARATETCL
jgi:hypothetical protein